MHTSKENSVYEKPSISSVNFNVQQYDVDVTYSATCIVCGHHMHVKDTRSVDEKRKIQEQGIKNLLVILS